MAKIKVKNTLNEKEKEILNKLNHFGFKNSYISELNYVKIYSELPENNEDYWEYHNQLMEIINNEFPELIRAGSGIKNNGKKGKNSKIIGVYFDMVIKLEGF